MSALFTYMGTKRRIAEQVASVIDTGKKGPMLDLFAGMSSVGFAVMPKRNVWCNDVQHFAHNVAKATFTSKQAPQLTAATTLAVIDLAARNESKLEARFKDWLKFEEDGLSAGSFRKVV